MGKESWHKYIATDNLMLSKQKAQIIRSTNNTQCFLNKSLAVFKTKNPGTSPGF